MESDYDYMKRGYLLPDGCKDLVDALKLKDAEGTGGASKGELYVRESMTVRELALSLRTKPYQLISDLLEMDVFACPDKNLDFDTIVQVARKYGCIIKKVE
ncbi:hypothetical protein BH23VER1_BH23VER1_10140 [soil metagenome]